MRQSNIDTNICSVHIYIGFVRWMITTIAKFRNISLYCAAFFIINHVARTCIFITNFQQIDLNFNDHLIYTKYWNISFNYLLPIFFRFKTNAIVRKSMFIRDLLQNCTNKYERRTIAGFPFFCMKIFIGGRSKSTV